MSEFGDDMEEAWNSVWTGARGQTDFQSGSNQISGADAARLNANRLAQLGYIQGVGGDYLGLTQAAARGDAPSQAQGVLQDGTSRTAANAQSIAASAPGGGAQRAAAMNQANWQAAQANQAGARQAAQLRAQEMSDARAQYGQGVMGVGSLMNQTNDSDLRRAQGNQDAATAATTTNAGIAQSNAENDKGFINNLIGSLSDIRAKDDITTVQPAAFSSTVQTGQTQLGLAGQDQTEQRDQRLLDDIRRQNQQSEPQPSQGTQGGGGFLSKIFSDERSKERIAELEGALSATTDALKNTQVEYPTLGLSEDESGVSAKRVAPTDLIFDERTDMFRTPEQQYRYQDALKRSSSTDLPENERLFLSGDESEMRTPLEQLRYSKGLEDRGKRSASLASRDALAPVGEHVYRYKPEFAEMQGTDTEPRVGIMAQELERSPSPELRSVVVDTPKGKAIDGPRALSANLGLTAGLDKRLREIESQLGGDPATLGLRRELGYR